MTHDTFGALRSALQQPQAWTRWEAELWPLITALHEADAARFEHQHAPYIQAQCRSWPRGVRPWLRHTRLDARLLVCDMLLLHMAQLGELLDASHGLGRHVTHLKLKGASISDDEWFTGSIIESLAHTDALPALRTLELHHTTLDADALRLLWLVREGALSGLDTLLLNAWPPDALRADDWLRWTADSPHAPHLTGLSIAWWNPPAHGLPLGALLERVAQPLRVLRARHSQLADDDVWPALARSVETLRELDLQHNAITFGLISRLIQRRWPALELVELQHQATRLSFPQVLKIATSHALKHTRHTALCVDEHGAALCVASPMIPGPHYTSSRALASVAASLELDVSSSHRDTLTRAIAARVVELAGEEVLGEDELVHTIKHALATQLAEALRYNWDLHERSPLRTLMALCEPLAERAPERLVAEITPQVHMLHERAHYARMAPLLSLPKDPDDVRLTFIQRLEAPARSHRRAATLLTSPHLSALNALDLEADRADPILALATNDALHRLRQLHLRLRHEQPSAALDDALSALAEADHLRNLQQLHVHLHGAPTPALGALLTGVFAPHLHALTLTSDAPLPAHTLDAIAGGLPMPELRALDAGISGAGGALAEALLARPLPALQDLSLRADPITSAQLCALLAAHPTLEALTFDDQPTTRDALAMIAAQDHPTLATITLSNAPSVATVWGWLQARDSPMPPRVELIMHGPEVDVALAAARPATVARCAITTRHGDMLRRDPDNPRHITQDHLKATLRALGLKVSGRKSEQLDRLREHMRTRPLTPAQLQALGDLRLSE